MDQTKFYIIVKATCGGAEGIIYFKQDTTKINLIVFFIVFASCFVFLLSCFSILWSIKNHLHSRQEVHNLEAENERRHNRPFAKFSFLFEYQPPLPAFMRHRKTTGSTRKAVSPMAVQCTSNYQATVTTVIFQMPQTEKTKMTVSLGTTLTLIAPQQMEKVTAQPSELKQTTNLWFETKLVSSVRMRVSKYVDAITLAIRQTMTILPCTKKAVSLLSYLVLSPKKKTVGKCEVAIIYHYFKT